MADHRQQQADDLFRLARTSIRTGDVVHGRTLLLKAVELDRDHSEAWLWLSATTTDSSEQRKYLEWAIAADPGNARARRGLAVLTGRIEPGTLLPEGAGVAPRRPAVPEPVAVRRTFDCPQCGGKLRFDPEIVDLRCTACGAVEVVVEEPLADVAHPLDFTLPTVSGHRWAESERAFTCEQCGAGVILPVGEASTACPFCGNGALVRAPEERELVAPDGLLPMGFEAEAADQAVRRWLAKGWWAPDDLAQKGRDRQLRPAYVPFWVFEATLTLRWRAEIAEGSGEYRQWAARTGERTEFFVDHVQAGLRALPVDLMTRLPAYDLSRLIAFKPEYLADWPTAVYDLSLADASLRAHEAMVKAAQSGLGGKVAAGQDVRDLESFPERFTGELYRLVFLPLWIGTYRYGGRAFPVVVNGQTGEVAGDRPRDRLKIGLAVALGLIGVALVTLLAIRLLAG